MSRSFLSTLAAVLALCCAGPAAAQLFTPSYLSPLSPADRGVYLSAGFPGGGTLAVEGVWRRSFDAFDAGVRAGIADRRTGAALLLGADYRNPLEELDAPVAFAVTGGAQLALGDEIAGGASAGVVLGRAFPLEVGTVTPYLHPRLGLGFAPAPATGLDLLLVAELGAELLLADGWVARASLGLGETSALGVGLAWR